MPNVVLRWVCDPHAAILQKDLDVETRMKRSDAPPPATRGTAQHSWGTASTASTAQHSPAQPATARHSTARHSTAQHSPI